jgi:acetyl-CoA carboxylase biotin carboxyl carrier protein
MDLRKLKTLIELVESSGIAELEIEEGEERVRITRAVAASPAASHVVLPAALPATGPAQLPHLFSPRLRRFRRLKPRDTRSRVRWSEPSIARPRRGEAFRRGGRFGPGRRHALHHRGHEAHERDRVRQGRVVKQVLAENGQPVEFGQPLVVIA